MNLPPKKFRTASKLHFLTYPQCEIPLEEIQKQLKEKYGDKYGWSVISSEDHEERENDTNVGVHRHVMIECCKNFETTNSRYWDLKYQEKVYHPHFEPAKKKVHCLKYVIKDGVYIVDGTYKELPFSIDNYLEANQTKSSYGWTFMANEIKSGKTLDDLDDVCPGNVARDKRKLEEYITFQNEKKIRKTPKPKFLGFQKPRNMPYDWTLIVDWANPNFTKPRDLRQDQLWICSKAFKLGKSWPWSVTLRKYFNLYKWSKAEKQGKQVLTCDYILMDEFKGHMSIADLKELSQMYGVSIDIKFGDITLFEKNVPLIITSNRTPREVYHKCAEEDIASLLSRFLVVYVDEYCELHPIEPEDVSPVPVEPEDISPVPIIEEKRDDDDHSDFSNDEFEKMEEFRRKD